MRRRAFLAALLGAAAAFLTRALAQAASAKRLGVLTMNPAPEVDAVYKPRVAALRKGLEALGWREGENLNVDWRFAGGDWARLEAYADELVALAPDALLAISTPAAEALLKRTRTMPIVFTLVTDPVGQGFIESLSRPGGDATGFTDFDVSMAGKWLEMLGEITPPAATIGVLYNPATAPFAERMAKVVFAAAAVRGVTARAAPVSDDAGLEAAMTAISREPVAGVLVMPDVFMVVHRPAILAAAARLRLPAVYTYRPFVLEGGLMFYGVDANDLHRRPAAYIDRILRGADPGDLPVQNPTKFDLIANLKTAHALGIEVSPTLLASADEAIE
jgi:putative ABC transport system substrate-binding protein